jgi:hypothetical protein
MRSQKYYMNMRKISENNNLFGVVHIDINGSVVYEIK